MSSFVPELKHEFYSPHPKWFVYTYYAIAKKEYFWYTHSKIQTIFFAAYLISRCFTSNLNFCRSCKKLKNSQSFFSDYIFDAECSSLFHEHHDYCVDIFAQRIKRAAVTPFHNPSENIVNIIKILARLRGAFLTFLVGIGVAFRLHWSPSSYPNHHGCMRVRACARARHKSQL